MNRMILTFGGVLSRNAKKWFTIEADDDVPFAKVIAVIEALKASGVTQFSFAKARVGDGK